MVVVSLHLLEVLMVSRASASATDVAMADDAGARLTAFIRTRTIKVVNRPLLCRTHVSFR